MKKGVLFGFDARISMVIFAALSLIAGAILFDVIKNSKTTALYNELKEVAKANEAYLLDYGVILDKQGDVDELTQSTRKITDLVTIGDKVSGSPYLSYELSGNALKHPTLGDVNIYTLSSDDLWGKIDNNSYCIPLKSCNIWVAVKGFTVEAQMKNLDEKFDDGIANSGSIRYDVAEAELFLESIAVPNSKRDLTATGSWVTGSWGACSTASTCGTGTQTRSVSCSSAYCDGSKPSTSQSCSTPCGSWIAGPWGSCSASGSCGDGIKTRSVTCSTSYCSGTRPSSSTSCVSSSCSYTWYTGSWSSCHGSCGMTGGVGDGHMVRNVYCKRSDGTRVSDGYCSGSKPNDRYDGCYFPCT